MPDPMETAMTALLQEDRKFREINSVFCNSLREMLATELGRELVRQELEMVEAVEHEEHLITNGFAPTEEGIDLSFQYRTPPYEKWNKWLSDVVAAERATLREKTKDFQIDLKDPSDAYQWAYDIIFSEAVEAKELMNTDSVHSLLHIIAEQTAMSQILRQYRHDEIAAAYKPVLSYFVEALEAYTRSFFVVRRRLLEKLGEEIESEYNQTGKTASAYERYLSTPEWKQKADLARERADGQCEFRWTFGDDKDRRCQSRTSLEVHHKNSDAYKRIPHERDSDLICLCQFHHEEVHGRRGVRSA